MCEVLDLAIPNTNDVAAEHGRVNKIVATERCVLWSLEFAKINGVRGLQQLVRCEGVDEAAINRWLPGNRVYGDGPQQQVQNRR